MRINDYIFYDDYLKNRKIINSEKKIFIAKTKNSYLIGPIIDEQFDEESFYKRLISSSIYNTKIYKKCFNITAKKLLKSHLKSIKSNEVLEIFKNGKELMHFIIPVPKGHYEKK